MDVVNDYNFSHTFSSRKIMSYNKNIYKARITEANRKKKLTPFLLNEKECISFVDPETDKTKQKIYIIKTTKDQIVYVGKTNQSLSSRLRQGLNPKKGTGYHGYKWKENGEIYIYSFTFEGLSDIEIEAIEAEIVFLVRREKGQWPDYQTEIHFHNDQDAKSMPIKIYNDLNLNNKVTK